MKQRFLIEAYRGGVLQAGYLGGSEQPRRVVCDLSSLAFRDTVKLKYRHKEVIGTIEHVEVVQDWKIVAVGCIDWNFSELARTVIRAARAGREWQASFAADGPCRFVERGQLNTKVFRQAFVLSHGLLTDISICRAGADPETSVRLVNTAGRFWKLS